MVPGWGSAFWHWLWQARPERKETWTKAKTGAQLYASACATCHQSARSVSKTKWFFGLESFLRDHYTSSSESAAILAAYLKGQQKSSADSQRNLGVRQMSQLKPPEPTRRV